MQFHAEGSFSVQWDRSEQCDHSLCSAVHIVRGWHCSRLDTNRFCIAQRLFLTFTFYVHFHHPAWQQGSRYYNLQMLQHMLKISWQLTQGHWYLRQMTPPLTNTTTTPPSMLLMSEAVDLDAMRGCHRKLWENVMEAISKIEKTNTWQKHGERQRQRLEWRRIKNNC